MKSGQPLVGEKGVKYGLQTKKPAQPAAAVKRPIANVFGGDSDEEETVGAQIARQAEKKRAAAKVRPLHAIQCFTDLHAHLHAAIRGLALSRATALGGWPQLEHEVTTIWSLHPDALPSRKAGGAATAAVAAAGTWHRDTGCGRFCAICDRYQLPVHRQTPAPVHRQTPAGGGVAFSLWG